MRYNVTELDKELVEFGIKYNYRHIVLNKDSVIVDELHGISSYGRYNIDADSNVRRTTSFVLELDNTYEIFVDNYDASEEFLTIVVKEVM